MKPLLSKVENYAELTKPKEEVDRFVEQGGWKARIGGRGLENGGNRIIEKISDDRISFSFINKTQKWIDVAPILGAIVSSENGEYTQIINNQEFHFKVSDAAENIVSYWPYSKMDRFVLSHLRGIANKVGYCFGCKACEVQCPVNAFAITDSKTIFIREDRCVHCYNCIEYTNGKGCLAAKSLSTSGAC